MPERRGDGDTRGEYVEYAMESVIRRSNMHSQKAQHFVVWEMAMVTRDRG